MTPTKKRITNNNYNGRADQRCPKCDSGVVYRVETVVSRKKGGGVKVVQGYFCHDCLAEYDGDWNYLQPLL